MRITLLIITIFFAVANAYSQDNEPGVSSKKWQFIFSSEYLSNYTFNGRADSLKNPSLSTGFEAAIGGLTLGARPNFMLQKNNRRFSFLELDASFDQKLTDKLSGSLMASKYFNSFQRNSINSSISGSVGAATSVDLTILQFTAEYYLLFSGKTDSYLNLELNREIIKTAGAFTLTLDPTIDVNFSSTRYYEGSITKNARNKTGKKQTATGQSVVTTTSVNPGIRLMDYEISIPLTCEAGKIGLSIIPTFAIPMNPVKTTSTIQNGLTEITIDSTPYSDRFLKNVVYTTFLLFLKF